MTVLHAVCVRPRCSSEVHVVEIGSQVVQKLSHKRKMKKTKEKLKYSDQKCFLNI